MNPIQIGLDELAASEPFSELGTAAEVAKSDDPPNPVLPEGNEIFWSAVFFLLFWLLMKYVLLPPVRAIQKKRQEQLDERKDSIDSSASEKQRLISENEAALAAVRKEASQIIEEARQRGEQYRLDKIAEAEAEAAEILAQNDRDLQSAKNQALEGLKEDVKELTSNAVALILGQNPEDKLVNAHIERVEKEQAGN